jgi:hypothetical protein
MGFCGLRNNGRSKESINMKEVIKMKKYFKIAVLTFLAVGLMSGSAFATLPNLDAGNTTMATELVQPTVDTAAPAVGIAYQTNGAVGIGTTLKFSLTNGTYATVVAAKWALCREDPTAPGAALIVTAAGPATTVGDVSFNLTTNAGLGVGTIYYLQDDNCAALGAVVTNINVLGGTTAGTVTMAITSVTNPGDAKIETSGVIVTLKDQFAAAITPVVSKMDFATGRTTLIDDTATNANYPNTTVAGTTSDAVAKIVVKNDATIGNKVTVTAPGVTCAGTINVADTVKVKVTGNLTGVDKLQWNAVTIGTKTSYTLVAADYTNGYASVTVPGTVVGICSTASPTAGCASGIFLDVDTSIGTTKAPALVAGDFTAEVKLVGAGAGAAGRTSATRVLTTAKSHTFAFDGTVYYLELARADATRETYVKIQSKNVTAGANGMSVQVLCGNGTMATFTPAATLTAGAPANITGTEMAAACAATSPVNAGGFAAILTVNAPEADVFGYANILDATGAKRIPLKTVNGAIVE